jgi:hypothetical protein
LFSLSQFSDLSESHPVIAKNLKQLLAYDGDDVEDMFGLDFQLSFEEFGVVRRVDLVENGAQVAVTNDNRQQFVDLYVEYLLETSIAKQVSSVVVVANNNNNNVFFLFFVFWIVCCVETWF